MPPILLQAAPSLYTNNVVLVFGALLLGLLGFWYYKLQKKNPNLDFGPLIATTMVSKHETIFIGVIFAEYIFAAMIASTVHATNPNEVEMSPLGRIGMHLIISVVGTVAQLTQARDIAVQFIKQPIGERLGNLYTLFMITLVAFFVPYANLMLIASGSGESLAFDIWVYSINPFVSDAQYAAKLIEIGYPPNYRAWENLSNAMHVCITSSLLVHYMLTSIEAARTLSSTQRRKILMDRVRAEQQPPKEEGKDEKGKDDKKNEKKNEIDKKINERGDEEKTKQIVPNAEFLLNRIGYDDADKRHNVATEIQNRILRAAEPDQIRLAYRLAQLVARAKTIDGGNDADKDQKKKQLQTDIREFFGGPDKKDGKLISVDKRGLGVTLKKN